MMRTYPNIRMFSADATLVAEALPCRHGGSVDSRTGDVHALAGRHAG